MSVSVLLSTKADEASHHAAKAGTFRTELVLGGSAVVGVALVLACISRYGPGLSPDSIGYVSIARNLMSGVGFRTYDRELVTVWPPLYPVLLAGVSWVLRLDPLSAAGLLDAAAFGLVVYLAGRLVVETVDRVPLLSYLGIVCVLAGWPILGVASFVLSETIFIVLELIFLLALAAHWRRRSRSTFVVMCVAAGLACLERYMGAAFVAAGTLAILADSKDGPGRRLVKGAAFVAVSSLPIAVWAARNHGLNGTFFGPRLPSTFSLAQNLSDTFNTMLAWFVPPTIVQSRTSLVVLCLAIGFAMGIGAHERQLLLSKVRPLVLASALVVCVYVAWLIISATTTAFDKIGNRLLSPIYVPTLVLALLALQWLVVHLTNRYTKLPAQILVVIVLLSWSVYPVGTAVGQVRAMITNGAGGYNSRDWINSETLQYIGDQSLTGGPVIYSNAPDAIYVLTGRAARMSPRRTHNSASAAPLAWPLETTYLVWFNRMNREYLLSPHELDLVANVLPLTTFSDGIIYVVSPRQ